MATKGQGRSGGGREGEGGAAQVSKTLKEGEKFLAPTRRPDGTLRKPIRIRAGYVPQDEVAVYKSKGSQLKEETVPPGYDPEEDAVHKPKTKSAKRNERKKEKRLQGKNEDLGSIDESIVNQMDEITISENPSVVAPAPPLNSTECVPDIDKRIRALKKKIRLTEAQQQKTGHDLNPEQVEKIAKLEDWRRELKLLEEGVRPILLGSGTLSGINPGDGEG